MTFKTKLTSKSRLRLSVQSRKFIDLHKNLNSMRPSRRLIIKRSTRRHMSRKMISNPLKTSGTRISSRQRTTNIIRTSSIIRNKSISPTYRRNNSPIIDRSFSKQYEFSNVGWGEAPTMSIFNRQASSNKPMCLDWPKELGPVLVLSIRPERMKRFEQRMGLWMKHMRRFPATDGRLINPKRWHRERRVMSPNMAPGRLGCYDTHVRIWETIAKSQFSVVTVLEDDVDFDYYKNGQQIISQLKERLDDVKQVNWEFLAWGHGPWAFGKNAYVPGLKYWKTPGTCQGFFAYTLTRELALKLIQQCRPFKGPAVDKWFYDDFIRRNHIKALTVEPRLCWVVDVISDTNNKIR